MRRSLTYAEGRARGREDKAARNAADPYRWAHAWASGFSDFCRGYESGHAEPDHSAHGGDLCTEGPDGCCTVCAVAMWNPCEVCGGKGYHRDTCAELDGEPASPDNAEDAWDDSTEGRGVTP